MSSDETSLSCTNNVGPGRFNPTIPPNREKTKEGSKSNITVHKTFMFYLRLHLRMNLAHDATVGERCMGNKKFPTHTKTYYGDVHLREEIWIYVPL